MKPFRLLLALPLLAGCATEPSRAEQLRAQYREGAALQARHENDPTYRSQEGFQETRWGMSREEVHALYPGAQVVGSTLQLDAPVAERPAHLTFRFVENRLSEVRAEFLQPQGQFDGLARLLDRKYGAPFSVTPDPSDADGKRAASTALAVLTVLTARGDHKLLAAQNAATQNQVSQLQSQLQAATQPRGSIWVRPETRITLALDPQGAQVLVVDYVARALLEKNLAATGQEARDADQRALDSL